MQSTRNQQPTNEKPPRKAWKIFLEIFLSLAFFGVCMFVWIQLRPRVLSAVFSEEPYPSADETEEVIDPVAVEMAAFEETIPLVAKGTPAPTPTDTPTPVPSPTPVPTKNPKNGDTLLAGDDEPIVLDIAIRLMELEYLDFDQPTQDYTEGVADASVNFMALKMKVDFAEGADPAQVMENVRKNCKKVESDCEIFLK